MKNMILAVACALALAAPALASKKPGKAVITETSQLEWKKLAEGVHMAVVEGDPGKGSSHFFIKYAAGLNAPLHHHSPDHYVALVSGNLVLGFEGKETRLTPGSYFSFTKKAVHSARCEEGADCIMFGDARGKWDVQMENDKKQ
ncbi:MAG TPA: cupin domain-containing protein [Bdellovibrionota bacterium]|nr:cupin domain-containing protein [Bdellovibrionota bacterium]